MDRNTYEILASGIRLICEQSIKLELPFYYEIEFLSHANANLLIELIGELPDKIDIEVIQCDWLRDNDYKIVIQL